MTYRHRACDGSGNIPWKTTAGFVLCVLHAMILYIKVFRILNTLQMLFAALSSHSAWLSPSWLILIVYVQRFSVLLTCQSSCFLHSKSCLLSLRKCSIICWEAAVDENGMSNQSLSVQLYSAPDKLWALWSQQGFSHQFWKYRIRPVLGRADKCNLSNNRESFLLLWFWLFIFFLSCVSWNTKIEGCLLSQVTCCR